MFNARPQIELYSPRLARVINLLISRPFLQYAIAGLQSLSKEDEFRRDNSVHLEWRDYVAIGIATLEITLLPILVTMVVLVLVVILLRL